MIYSFENNETGEITEEVMKLADLEQFKKDNPHLTQIITGFAGFVVSNGGKPDNVFRDILTEIKKVNPGSTINTW